MKRQIRLLAQADLLLLMADLFRPPEIVRHSMGLLKKPNLKMLIDATGLKSKKKLTNQLHAAVELARQTNKQEWAQGYRLLFDSSMVCPMNEAAYIRRDKGSIISDICGFYSAFGWTGAASSGRRPDHLLLELEFAAILLVMSARAQTREQSEATETALADFTRHHLSDWLLVFSEQLKRSTSYPLFVEAANLLTIVWPALVKWHEWTADAAAPPPSESVPNRKTHANAERPTWQHCQRTQLIQFNSI